MTPRETVRWRVWALGAGLLGVLLLGSPSALARGYRPPPPAGRYKAVVDPLIDGVELTLAAAAPLMCSGPIAVLFIESWRCWALSVLQTGEDEERQALLSAVATHQLLGVMKSVRAGLAGADFLLPKMQSNLEWYEQKYPAFRGAYESRPYTPPGQLKDAWETYEELRGWVDKDMKQLKDKGKAVLDLMATLRQRAAQGKLVYVALAQNNDVLMRAVGAYQSELAELDWWLYRTSEWPRYNLSGRDLEVRFKNTSKDLVFFVQIAARQPDRTHKLRADCTEPVPLYPNDWRTELQTVEPKGCRGPSSIGFVASPGDQVILRVATMGPVRDRIRFMPFRGRQLKPSLNSIPRNFWSFGYVADLPNVEMRMGSSWGSRQESYTWTVSGGWAESPTRPVITNSNPKDLGSSWDVAGEHDQMSWVLPESHETCVKSGSGWTHVVGEATFDYARMTAASKGVEHQDITERGDGWLEMKVRPW